MTNDMSESERAAMGRLFDRFPSRAPVDAVEVLAEIRRAVAEERARIVAAFVAMSQEARSDADKSWGGGDYGYHGGDPWGMAAEVARNGGAS